MFDEFYSSFFFFFISGKHILDDNAYFSFPFYLCVFLILFYVSFSSVVAESILVGAQDCPQTGVFTRRAGFNLGTIQRKKEKKKKPDEELGLNIQRMPTRRYRECAHAPPRTGILSSSFKKKKIRWKKERR